jgi:RecB family exonuclease
MQLSYSALKLFETCPYLYKYIYVEGHKPPESKEARFGSLIHEVLETVHQDPVSPAPLPEALNYLKKVWAQKELEKIFDSSGETKVYFQTAQEMIKGYYSQKQNFATQILATEKFFKIPFSDPKSNEIHFIRGRIDRVDKHPDGSYEVIDYKTSARLPKEAMLQKSLQLPLYHMGLVEFWPSLFKNKSRTVKLTLYFLRHGERMTFVSSQKQLEQTRIKILKTIRELQLALEKNDFPARRTALCGWYPYSTICPYFKHQHRSSTTEKSSPSEKEIQALTQEYLELKSRISQSEKRLQQVSCAIHAYLDQEKLEGLYAPGGKIERYERPQYQYDRGKLKKLLEPLGLWEKSLTISNTALSQITKELSPALRAKIKKARLKTGTQRILRIRKNS